MVRMSFFQECAGRQHGEIAAVFAQVSACAATRHTGGRANAGRYFATG
jgi:hypothetical protein